LGISWLVTGLVTVNGNRIPLRELEVRVSFAILSTPLLRLYSETLYRGPCRA
jgi:hypothetical protein